MQVSCLKNSNIVAAIFLMFVCSFETQAQTSEAGVLFLLVPPGARHNGMGQTGVSTANDANAIYYNPGALGFIATQETPRDVQFMHVNWLPQFNLSDLFYDYGSVVMYLPDIGVVGYNFTYFNIGEQQRTNAAGDDLGTIHSYELSTGVTYATKMTEDWGIGGNFKFIYSSLDNKKGTDNNTAEVQNGVGSSVAIDIGVMKKNFFVEDLTFGASLVNVGPSIAYADEDQADPLPTNLRLGVSYPAYQSEFNNVLVAYEINRQIVRGRSTGSDPLISGNSKFFTRSAIFTTWADNGWHRLGHNIGAEYTYSDFVAMRTGTSLDFAGKLYDLTFGVGIRYDVFKIDFAYSTGLTERFNARDGSQFYSIGVRF